MPIATPQGTLDFKSVDTVTFVGASSNTVIDTTTGSLGVGVDGNGPTSNLHVVGHTRLEGDINMLHTSNTASIKLNSNVVTEFPRSKKLIKYPRVALTANSDNGYLVDASSRLDNTDWAPYRAFNTIAGEGEGWHDEGTTYSTGVYTGTNSVTPVTGTAVSGEWIKIQLPEKIKLEKVRLAPRQAYTYRMPKDATILGSINGTDWYRVTSWSGQTYISGNNYRTINVNSEQYYNYYVLVVEALGSDPGGNSVNIGEWELFGIPEYDPEAHGTDVVVKSVPNVPNTDWLEVYYDAKGLDDAGVVTTVNDLKPSSLGSAINSSSVTNISVSDEAFVFNGSSSGINATLSNPQGPWVHSVSVWVKLGKDHGDYGGDNVFSIGNVAGTAQLESLRIYANDVRFVTFQGGADAVYSLPMDRNRWYHFTLTYDGGATNNSFKLFRDGIFYTGTTTATPIELNVAANALLSIGYERVRNRSHFNGSIANFRLFNRALTTDEIYQLYAYQKEYFGHGVLGMTLKAGRLGIGTSEPRAALDVMGGNISGYTIPYAIGGENVNFGKYKVHIFRSSGTFTVKRPGAFEVLIVAGGGGGGRHYGGGGGAGGLINSCNTLDTGDYVVTIGGGGGVNTRGSNSSIISNNTRLIAFGGGCGGNYSSYPSDDMDGGSGGGGGSPTNAQQGNFDWRIMPGGNSTSGQGSNGGLGFHSSSVDAAGGGGGGAGNPGKRAVGGTTPGNGGTGKSFNFYSNDLVYYAGGGGGGEGVSQSGTGGAGGGGNGAAGNDSTGTLSTAGAINTGGGGGGGGSNGGAGGSSGGSGIVLIRYLT